MSNPYSPVEGGLITPRIAFHKSVTVDGGVISDTAVIGNERYQLIVRPEGVYVRMPCNFDDNGELLDTSDKPRLKEYNLGALIEAIQELNRRTAWTDTNMDLATSLIGTDVLYDSTGQTKIDYDGPIYDTVNDLLPMLKDPTVFTLTLVDGDNKLIDISNTSISNIAVDEIGKTMTDQGITSLALSDEDIASLFPMASYIGERSVQATISPLTALLIPYITLVGKDKLYIKICFDGNHDNPNEPHVYTDGVYTYSYSEIGEESSIEITKNETRSDAAYIENPWILTLNKNNNNSYDIYHMINAEDARITKITEPTE